MLIKETFCLRVCLFVSWRWLLNSIARRYLQIWFRVDKNGPNALDILSVSIFCIKFIVIKYLRKRFAFFPDFSSTW